MPTQTTRLIAHQVRILRIDARFRASKVMSKHPFVVFFTVLRLEYKILSKRQMSGNAKRMAWIA